MVAKVLAFVPRGGFTVRLVRASRWELRNNGAYGPSYVLASWPKDQVHDALEHCYRLNGFDSASDAQLGEPCPVIPASALSRRAPHPPNAGQRGRARRSPVLRRL